MKLKFGDPESILFVKKELAKRWLIKNLEEVLDEFEDKNIITDEEVPEHPDIVINYATDFYFWFTLYGLGPELAFLEGSIFKWQKKKWYVYYGHIKPKPLRERKGQLFFEGCEALMGVL